MQEAIGESEAFIGFQERVSRVAPIERPVLILGERGSGKELAAIRLHFMSQRWEAPLVTLNCAALNPSLIEAELFGHEKGAFTGAMKRRMGRFEAADKGSFFLDEIGTIPLEVQEKILRVVEYGVFERVGGTEPVHVDVRIIAATNADLVKQVQTGRFKQDLLDRLTFEVLFVPPLRERKSDIRILAEHFANGMALELNQDPMPEFNDKAVAQLENHDWPGNIRELKNVVERAVYRSENAVIDHIVFDPFEPGYAGLKQAGKDRESEEVSKEQRDISEAGIEPVLSPVSGRSFAAKSEQPLDRIMEQVLSGDAAVINLKDAVKNLEIQLIRAALVSCGYNQKCAARRLGLTYDQFRGLKRKHGRESNGIFCAWNQKIVD